MLIRLINSLFGLWEVICVGIGGYYAYKLVGLYKTTPVYRGWIKFLLSKQLTDGIVNVQNTAQANSPDKYDVEYHQNDILGGIDRVTMKKQHKYIVSSGEVAIAQRLMYLFCEGFMYFFTWLLCYLIPSAIFETLHIFLAGLFF